MRQTAPLAVAAGANVLVAGTAIFGESEGVAAAMNRLRAGSEPVGNAELKASRVSLSQRSQPCNSE